MATKTVARTLVNVQKCTLNNLQLADIPVFGTSKLASKLSLWQGDITSLNIKCIVNDVNSDIPRPSMDLILIC